MAESLETRQLLSVTSATQTAIVKGTDPDGAQWTLRLFGPGALSVTGTNGDVFSRTTQSLSESIDSITVGGSISTETRLVGTVKASPSGDSRVYFQNLLVTNSGELGKIDVGQVSNFRTVQNGISAVDMPDFYLAHTETTAPSKPSLIHSGAMSAGEINIPQGVNTLRFGGVDVDYTPATGTLLTSTNQNNEFQIALGLPIVLGTSVIVNSVNSDAQAGTGSSAGTTFQDYATFLVTGRLNLFQANSITGNTNSGLVPSQFPNQTSPTTSNPGGTYVISQGGPVTGQIGDVRVGGNATNFTTFVTEDPLNVEATEGQLDAKISNYYIGGQTDNVILIAPSGSRNIAFGLGMDNVTINTLAISSLTANRDAIDSQVTVSRSIGNLLIGGDVDQTDVNVGESQSLFAFANSPASSVFSSGHGVFFGDLPPTVANPQTNPITQLQEPFAQNGGTMKVRIAGGVTNSVFSASVDGNASQSTTLAPLIGPESGNLLLPRGVINAKVEGTIDNTNNSLVTDPSKAFFGKVVHLTHGAVIPPKVPYAPLPAPTVYDKGQASLKGLFKIDHRPRTNVPNVSRHKKAKSK
jgi:hypothetical protein